jgi:hypothetical protein
VTLAGNHGVLIRIEPIGNWTSYSGPTEFDPPFPRLREARLIENFEAVQQWGLGVQGNTCVRVSTLSGPYRLVVDVALK